jgi:hypothetical protein
MATQLETLMPAAATAFAAVFAIYTILRLRQSQLPLHLKILVSFAAVGVTAVGVMDVLDAPRLVFCLCAGAVLAALAGTIVASVRFQRSRGGR